MPPTAGLQHLPTPRARRAASSGARPQLLRALASSAVVTTLCIGLALGPRPVLAAPSTAAAAAPQDSKAALESGDLSSARDLAVAAREADPSPANWAREAEAATALGDYERAIAAWQGHLASLPENATNKREAATTSLEQLQQRARGTVNDEPPSSHRDEIDGDRARRIEALLPPEKPQLEEKKAPPPKPKERIIKKWYFWVTVAAIAASAGAITGIAVQAAREEQMDDLSARGGALPTGPGGFVLRF